MFFCFPPIQTMRVLILALLAGVALAAPGDKKILVCGARQQGVGGSMGTVLKNATAVQTAVSVSSGGGGV